LLALFFLFDGRPVRRLFGRDLFTVAAAISFERRVECPRFFALRLMCSY
jgi:hypothetical protein